MQTIKLKDRIIYRASKGKKVKFVNNENTYVEIVVDLNDTRKIEEVKA